MSDSIQINKWLPKFHYRSGDLAFVEISGERRIIKCEKHHISEDSFNPEILNSGGHWILINPDLHTRVSNLESEIRSLSSRLTALEVA